MMAPSIKRNNILITNFVNLNTAHLKTVKESGNNYMADLYDEFQNFGPVSKDTFRYSGNTYTIISTRKDKNKKSKIIAIKKAIRRVRDAGLKLPNLTVKTTNNKNIACQSTHTDGSYRRVMVVYMSDKLESIVPMRPFPGMRGGTGGSRARGVADQLVDREKSNSQKKSKFYEATMVHELGHILHEYQSENIFWRIKYDIQCEPPVIYKPHDDVLYDLSQYCATNNLLEFIAEAFTGKV